MESNLTETFKSWQEADNFLRCYFQKNYHAVRKGSKNSIASFNKKVSEKCCLPLELEVYSFTYVCKHYGERKSRSNGIRPNQTVLPSLCHFHVTITYRKQLQLYGITSKDLIHTGHPHGREHYKKYASIRKPSGELKKTIQAMLETGSKPSSIAKFVRGKGYHVSPKDIYNLRVVDEETARISLEKKQEKREHVTEFINAYKNAEALWNVKNAEYRDKTKKEMAYRELLKIFKKIKKSADLAVVKNKIHALRKIYFNELRKIEESKLQPAAGQEVYEPKCWSFRVMRFLGDDIPKRQLRIKQIKGNTEQDEFDESSNSDSSDRSLTEESRSAVENISPNSANELINKTVDQMPPIQPQCQDEVRITKTTSSSCTAAMDDDDDVISKGWLVRLKRMNRMQRLLAEKFINEILLEGELGTLNRRSVNINCNPQPTANSSSLIGWIPSSASSIVNCVSNYEEV